jgi:hypothetical protein
MLCIVSTHAHAGTCRKKGKHNNTRFLGLFIMARHQNRGKLFSTGTSCSLPNDILVFHFINCIVVLLSTSATRQYCRPFVQHRALNTVQHSNCETLSSAAHKDELPNTDSFCYAPAHRHKANDERHMSSTLALHEIDLSMVCNRHCHPGGVPVLV